MLKPYRVGIEAGWIDYNGHLRDAYYGLILSYATDDLMDQVGLDAAYRESTHCTLYTLEVHLHYLHEVKSTDLLEVESLVLETDRKRLLVGSRFHCARVPEPVAVAESMLLHVHQGERVTTAAFPDTIAVRLGALRLAPETRAAFGPSSRKLELQRR
jgi:acyl-CoA thioester hydrolase